MAQTNHRQRKRIRIITDPVKYRRGQRRKLLRRLGWALAYAGVAALLAGLMWLLLTQAGRVSLSE